MLGGIRTHRVIIQIMTTMLLFECQDDVVCIHWSTVWLELKLTCLQEFSESLSLKVQYLDTLPQVGSAAVPIAQEAPLLYPDFANVPLASSVDTLLFSEEGCVTTRCGPTRLQLAQYVADMKSERQHNLIANVALSSWVKHFFESSPDQSLHSLYQSALQDLRSAAAGFADLDLVTEDKWLKVVATAAPTQPLGGRNSSVACQQHTTEQPGLKCDCKIDVPALFSHSMYGIVQIPVVMLDMTLKPNVPDAVVEDIRNTFMNAWAKMSAGSDVCVSTATSSLSRPTGSGCTGAHIDQAPPLPPGTSVAGSGYSQNASEGWTVSLHHGICSTFETGAERATVPWFDARVARNVSVVTRSRVDFSKSSCSQGFEQLPSAEEWTKGFCLGAETGLRLQTRKDVQFVRIVVSVDGAMAMAATVLVDGKAVAWVEKHSELDVIPGILRSSHSIDAFVLLDGELCRTLQVVYDAGGDSSGGVASNEVCMPIYHLFQLHSLELVRLLEPCMHCGNVGNKALLYVITFYGTQKLNLQQHTVSESWQTKHQVLPYGILPCDRSSLSLFHSESDLHIQCKSIQNLCRQLHKQVSR